MKHLAIALAIFCLGLVGCNTVGPYTAQVYRLDKTILMVTVSTWLGSDGGWPHGDAALERKAEIIVKKQLTAQGFPVEKCVFMKFTPSQGGHMTITLVAGEGLALRRWETMTEEEFYTELRKRMPLPNVLQFAGRLEE